MNSPLQSLKNTVLSEKGTSPIGGRLIVKPFNFLKLRHQISGVNKTYLTPKKNRQSPPPYQGNPPIVINPKTPESRIRKHRRVILSTVTNISEIDYLNQSQIYISQNSCQTDLECGYKEITHKTNIMKKLS